MPKGPSSINPDTGRPYGSQFPAITIRDIVKAHYLLLNLAVGSNGGDPAPADYPARFEVDYVRVYQSVK